MDLATDRETFAEQGFIGPFTLWEPEEMTAWWKVQRKALLDPANNSRDFDDLFETIRRTTSGRHYVNALRG